MGERERLARFCLEALGQQGLARRNGCRVSGLVEVWTAPQFFARAEHGSLGHASFTLEAQHRHGLREVRYEQLLPERAGRRSSPLSIGEVVIF